MSKQRRDSIHTWAFALVCVLACVGVLTVLVYTADDPRLESRADAAGAATTLMSVQTQSGPGLASVSTNPTPGETGAERHSFQYHASVSRIAVYIQRSNDSGTTWATVHVFTGSDTHDRLGTDETWPTDGLAACGTCQFRAYKPQTTVGTVSVTHVVSGAALALAPTYTNTPTATVTITPTVTLTRTVTRTPTITPTFTATSKPPLTRTPTPVPTATRTPVARRTSTPTVTPTHT